jgi:hypothetical protein
VTGEQQAVTRQEITSRDGIEQQDHERDLASPRWVAAGRSREGTCFQPLCHFAVAVIVTVTGIGPRLNAMTPPSAAARAAVDGAQFAGVPVPVTWRPVVHGAGTTRRNGYWPGWSLIRIGAAGRGALRSRQPAAGAGAMDVTPCPALGVYILVLTGLCLVVASPSPAPALACLTDPVKRRGSTLIEVRHGWSAVAVAAIERSGRRGRHQKLVVLLNPVSRLVLADRDAEIVALALQ